MQDLQLTNLEDVLRGTQGVSKRVIQDIYAAMCTDIDHALAYVNEKEQRFRAKDQLIHSYEKIIKEVQDQYEGLLFTTFLEKQGKSKQLSLKNGINVAENEKKDKTVLEHRKQYESQ